MYFKYNSYISVYNLPPNIIKLACIHSKQTHAHTHTTSTTTPHLTAVRTHVLMCVGCVCGCVHYM